MVSRVVTSDVNSESRIAWRTITSIGWWPKGGCRSEGLDVSGQARGRSEMYGSVREPRANVAGCPDHEGGMSAFRCPSFRRRQVYPASRSAEVVVPRVQGDQVRARLRSGQRAGATVGVK